MKKGDHLVTPRLGYSHHGLYLGDNLVIHYTGLADGLTNKDQIKITPLEIFSQGHPIKIRQHTDCIYTAEQIIDRALSRMGENNYHVIFNNCEHFVMWSIMGKAKSHQLKKYLISTASTLGAIGTTALIKAIIKRR